MDNSHPPPQAARAAASGAKHRLHWLSRRWMLVFSLAYGAFVALPFLAPFLMHLGWAGPARAIYLLYSFLCHQLPERSFFLFGPKTMYGLGEIQAAWQPTLNPLLLRQFVGLTSMGWKVAWSDRMISMYSSVLVFVWVWWPLRRRTKPLPAWGLIAFLLPMAIDGTTHFISDLAGLSQGFRYQNAWLAALTGNALPPSFYAGDALGSFNSWMRLLTGVLFGAGSVWFAFPHLLKYFNGMALILEKQFERAGLRK